MKVDLYERIWMWSVGLMLTALFVSLALGALRADHHPPSHVETIDPRGVLTDARFRTQGVRLDAEGRIHVWVVGLMFTWLPAEVTIPADTPVTFHLTSVDVTHGYQIVRTNGQTMLLPGYVSQFTTQFAPGEYLVACNEYCGLNHHGMAGRLHVVPRAEWTPPAGQAPAQPTSAASATGPTGEVRHAGH